MPDNPQTTKPKPFDHKSRMRLIEHGEDWQHVKGPQPVSFSRMPHILLRAVKTGYLRWWPHV